MQLRNLQFTNNNMARGRVIAVPSSYSAVLFFQNEAYIWASKSPRLLPTSVKLDLRGDGAYFCLGVTADMEFFTATKRK
jgi:hypothetical protein